MVYKSSGAGRLLYTPPLFIHHLLPEQIVCLVGLAGVLVLAGLSGLAGLVGLADLAGWGKPNLVYTTLGRIHHPGICTPPWEVYTTLGAYTPPWGVYTTLGRIHFPGRYSP